ncbi:MAG TPA: hypothetical protein VG733_11330, partial [Chthoniobacteraceae bacterium]|nr:hypothetical protein [Chthoniobacteraceae bacterium]
DKNAPLVFNFGMGAVGIFREYEYFKRLLADGYKPQRVGIEIFAADVSHELFATRDGQFLVTRARWGELDDYRRYSEVPPDLEEIWKESRWNPLYRYGMTMPHQTLSWRLIPLPGIRRMEQMPYDPWGWVLMENTTPEAEYRELFPRVKDYYQGYFKDFHIPPKTDLALRAFLDLCRDRGIRPFFLEMPESEDFRAMHTAEGDSQLDAWLSAIRKEYDNVPLIDASKWIGRAGFTDGHHLNGEGAAEFTRRFGEAMPALEQ